MGIVSNNCRFRIDFENINIRVNRQMLLSVSRLFVDSVFYCVAVNLKGEYGYETRQNVAGARSRAPASTSQSSGFSCRYADAGSRINLLWFDASFVA